MNVDIKIGDFLFSRSCFRKTYTTNTGVGYFHLARMIGMNIVDDDIECTIELLDGTIHTSLYLNTSGNYRTCNIPYYDFFKKEKYRLYEEENDWKDKSKSFVIRTDYKHFPVLKHCLYAITKRAKKWKMR